MKIRGSSGNALARSLNESWRNVLIEGTHQDIRGDKWTSHQAAHRNELHPNFLVSEGIKKKDLPHLDGVRHELQKRQVFVNLRTGDTHEGGLLLHPDGKASVFSHSGNPSLFNVSQYHFAKE
jgi:hypothetical protein